MENGVKHRVCDLLALAGIDINGSRPWDIVVHDDRFYGRVITDAELGLGESYMDGWWDAEKPDEFIFRIVSSDLRKYVRNNYKMAFQLAALRLVNKQSKRRAFIIGEKHYDLGNDLFRNMLDRRMNYSCAYWKDAADLNIAQEKKLDLICRKLNLRPGMKILDIGCGWGAFGKYACEKYGVEVTGITVSKEQVALGRELCSGLPVEFRLEDYRDVKGHFDRIVSVGMVEHVGYRNYRKYFETARKHLSEDGLFLLHCIGNPVSVKDIDTWTHRYIFPNGMLPSIAQLSKASEGLFIIEDLHNFRSYYDNTLMAWHNNFIINWENISSLYSERFFRMWNYFLLSSAGGFRAANSGQLWQIVLSPDGVRGGYTSIR